MRWLKLSLWVAIAVLMTRGPAAAQTTTGTITGRVVDGQGLSVPGVTVNAEGPNLQGVRTAVTSENGDYILPQLPPGTYTVTFELSGFERQQKTVALAPTQTLPLERRRWGRRRSRETVNVVGSSADVLTQTAQVATNFKQDLIATLPTNRDINATLLMAPAVHPSGPAGNYSIAGAMSFESLLHGERRRPSTRTCAASRTTSTSRTRFRRRRSPPTGVSAEYGRFSGGVVNVITKSGGNLFSGSFRDTLNNDNWRALRHRQRAHPFTADCATCGAAGRRRRSTWWSRTYEYTFGGPIMQGPPLVLHRRPVPEPELSRSTIAPLNIPYIADNRASGSRAS